MSKESTSGDKPYPRKRAETSSPRVTPVDRGTPSIPKEIVEKKVGGIPPEKRTETHAHAETPASRSFLHDYLGKHQSYSPESEVARYVQGRLDYITEGRSATVIVVHDDDPNAFAIPGMMVVHDGLLKLADYQEELDGILGHEWTHLDSEHVHDEDQNASLAARLGRRRKHETEADFKPLELLDRRNINPAGLASMLQKLETWQKQRKKELAGGKKVHKRIELLMNADVEHGSLLDRRLQLDETNKYVDIRNLSDEFTPLPITPDALEEYEDDTMLWETFDELSPLEKRHFLQRQFRECLTIDNANESDPQVNHKLRQLVVWQKELLADTTQGLSDEELEERTVTSIYLGYDVSGLSHFDEASKTFVDNSHLLIPAGVDIEGLCEKFTTEEEVRRLFDLMHDESFATLGIDMDKNKGGLYSFAEKVFTVYLQSQTRINADEYVQLVSDTGVIDKSTFLLGPGEWFMSNDLLYNPLLRVLKEKGQYTEPSISELANALTDISVSESEIESALIAELSEVEEESFPTDSQRLKKYDPVGALLISQLRSNRIRRIETAIDDPLRLFTSDITSEHSEKIAEVAKEHFPVERTLAFVADYSLSHKEALPADIRAKIIDTYRDVFYMRSDSSEESDLQLNQTEFEAHLKIWALAPDKETYLRCVKTDLSHLFEGRKRSLRELEKLADTIVRAPTDVSRGLRLDTPWEVTKEDLSKLSSLVDATVEKAFEKADAFQNPTQITELVQGIPAFKTKDERWDTVVTQLLSEEVSVNDPAVAEKLFALGVTTDNPHILLEVPRKAAEAYVTHADFDDGIRFIFDTYGHMPRHLFVDALMHLIEEKARTPEEFEALDVKIREGINRFFDDDTTIGELAVGDAFLFDQLKTRTEEREHTIGIRKNTISGIDAGELLEAMLASGESDAKLKKFLLDRWWLMCRLNPEVQEYFDIEGGMTVLRHPGKDARFAHWAHEVPPSYTSFADVVSTLQLSGAAMKYATLRKLLTGEGGVFSDEESKREFAETFLSEKVDLSDPEGGNMTSELVHALMAVGDQEALYHQLNPVLQKMILAIPEDPTELRVFAREKGKELLADLHQRGLIKNPTDRDRIHLTRKVYSLMTGGRTDELTQDLSGADKQLLALFAEEGDQEHEGKLSPWDLGIRVGKQAGALGTRTWQLAGQYFDIPEDEEEKVMDVYDDMKGQSRLQAYRVLMREAESSQEIAALMENVAEIRPRIGGGSLMTVYDFLLKDGSREAVGVRNPNVLYTLSKSSDLVGRAIQKAQADNPGERNYQLLGVLLDDVQEWIGDELADPRFEEKDRQFRESNDSRYGNFDTSSHRYGILVPESKPTGTRWVRRDEYIEGKNLTSLKVIEGETDIAAGQISTEDYRDAVSVLAKNYFYQLTTGLVHPDIQPGNFRITADNRNVAIFDRYNLLELTGEDQQFIFNMLGSYASGDTRGMSTHFVDYLLTLDENQQHYPQKDAIIEEVASVAQGETMIDSIIRLKQQGIKVPLKIGLIGRGLQVFDTMAKQAGFASLVDALA